MPNILEKAKLKIADAVLTKELKKLTREQRRLLKSKLNKRGDLNRGKHQKRQTTLGIYAKTAEMHEKEIEKARLATIAKENKVRAEKAKNKQEAKTK